MNTLAKAKHLHELVKMNSGTVTDEYFNELLEKGEGWALGAMKHAYWRSCKISNVTPMRIDWMEDFYEEKRTEEEMMHEFGL